MFRPVSDRELTVLMNSSVPSSAEAVRAQRTALVVDDVHDMLDLLEIALHAAGFSVLRASSAAEALDVFESKASEIDLLMTDVRVGGDSGLELARKLIAVKPTLHVLAISGFALDGRLVLATGKIEFLSKPFSTSELKNKLRSIFAPEPGRVTMTVSSGAQGNLTLSTNCAPGKTGKGRNRIP